MPVEIKNPDPLGFITSVYIEADDSPHVRITVRVHGQSVGTLTVDRTQGMILPALLLGADAKLVPILERCVSLVQSMAKNSRECLDVNESTDRLHACEEEAAGIAKDAGWET